MKFGKFGTNKKIKFCLNAVFFTVTFFAFSAHVSAAIAVYYSVGQNTNDHKTGTPTVTVSGNTATFSVAQTATNMGVGDVIDYDSDNKKCYISGKTSTSVWSCVTVIGGTPTAANDVVVNSISHTFNSLSAALPSGAGGVKTLLGNSDLTALDVQLNVTCYYDSGADTTAVNVGGFVTDATRYIKIYTPSNIVTEANVSQRHAGKWNDGKYRIEVGTNVFSIGVKTMIDGIQMKVSRSVAGTATAVQTGSLGNTSITIVNSIIVGNLSGGAIGYGVWNPYSGDVLNFANNIVYGFLASGSRGVKNPRTAYIYNNTFSSSEIGIENSGTAIAKNNIFISNTTSASGTYAAGTDYNLSDSASIGYTVTGGGNIHDKVSQTASFADAANKDFHLIATDTTAKNAGVDLSADANLPFSTDIDGQTRPNGTSWDIGADETANNVYYSVGQSASDLKTGTPTLTITAGSGTFSVAQTGNIGVGDRVTYNTNQIAYISAKTNSDGMHWSLVTATGGVPGDISNSTVVSITHEFTSLSAAVTAAGNASHINNTDLTAANVVLNLPCYYDSGADTTAVTVSGYTTGANNYIKIYTPVSTATEANNSQRHSGKWDDGKYKIELAAPFGGPVGIASNYTIMDGIQIKYTATMNYGNLWVVSIGNNTDGIKIQNCIINSIDTYDNNIRGIGISDGGGICNVNNNLMYGSALDEGVQVLYTGTLYAYSNTIVDVGVGIHRNSGTIIAKNNLAQNCSNNCFSGSFNASSISNVSSDATAPGSNAKANTTVKFTDAANKDFHLDPSDTAAKNAGADLSADANFAFNADIDGQTRSGSWDIGADEAATAVYYSVGQNTNDHKTGTSTVTIASGTATFSTAQTATNMGVGDKVTYNTSSVAYISAKISTTQWKLITATGETPADVTGQTVNSIAHAFNSLSAAEAGAPTLLGTSNLVAGNYQLNFPCYYDSGADTTMVTISGYTTGAANYINIYTPSSTLTEVNQSQRHQGRWDSSKYALSTDSQWYGSIRMQNSFIRVDGLQIENTANADTYNPAGINGESAKDDVRISNNIIRFSGGGAVSLNGEPGVSLQTSALNANFKVFNNIIYGFGSGVYHDWAGSAHSFAIYNNTFYGMSRGVRIQNSTSSINLYLKNNISYNNLVDYSNTNFTAYQHSNNISKDATSPDAAFQNKTVSFVDAANKDFHLSSTDIAANNAGADLSADLNFAFNTDIDGQARPSSSNATWDIGADEAATAIYYSVGQNTNDHKTGTPTLDISNGTATFSVAQTATNMGVGDKVTYNGATVAYISAKISTTQWKLITATGGTPADVTGQTVNSIAHAFNSLNAAVTGASGASYLNTSDLVVGNYQLNIPCYYDSGADTATVTVQNYTTAPANHVRIYTPNNISTEVNVSQRHQGKWDDGKYAIKANDYFGVIKMIVNDVKIDGLQIENTKSGVSNEPQAGIYAQTNAIKRVDISNNIIREIGKSLSSADNAGVAFDQISGIQTLIRLNNNVIYGFSRGIRYNVAGGSSINELMMYNNTIKSNGIDFNLVTYSANDILRIKNNITQSSQGLNYSFESAIETQDYANNLSYDATSPNAILRNKTVSFADAANKDFHLSPADITAKNQGTSLESDSALAFNTDIDGQTRSGSWDIGADEGANNVFYSVGQSAADLKTGTPTVTIASGTATFSTAQTGNIGVGDRVTYNTSSIAYIVSKIDQSNWKLVTATGGVPADIAGSTVVSIKHEYTSLSAAVAGASDVSHINNTDLTAANVVLNLPCYYDSGADTTAVTVSGYTTGANNYIKIYTPSNTSTEANNSQRHQGKWDDGRYRLQVANNYNGILNSLSHTHIDGLQVSIDQGAGFGKSGIAGAPYVSNSIIKSIGNYIAFGIKYHSSSPNTGEFGYIYNNIVYDIYSDNSTYGDAIFIDYETVHVYNNTIFNSYTGIRAKGHIGTNAIAKNNVVQNCRDGYAGTFNVSSSNNISDLASDAPGTNSKNGVMVKFADVANKDFHLAADDMVAKGAGADLSADSNFAFNTDIDGNTRAAGLWDIGADQTPTKIFYSVGQNTNDHKTGNPTVTIVGKTATFSVAQTASNMGVGDIVTYAGGTCFISEKISTLDWKCQTATGGVPNPVINAAVTSITHAFASLSSAIHGTGTASATGAGNATHLNTLDLVTGNYILNIPVYYDTGPDTLNSSGITLHSWKTSQNNSIKIYAPNDTISEVNFSQRHSGKWDDVKYNLFVNGNFTGIYFYQTSHVIIDGLQISFSNPSGQFGFLWQNSVGILNFKNNIVRSTGSGGSGVFFNDGNTIFDLSNNLFYGWNGGRAIYVPSSKFSYIYNNTISDSDYGITGTSKTIAKNNIANASVDGYVGSLDATSNYNISNLAADAPGANSKNSTTVSFVDAANFDFHLSNTDTSARDAGMDLSNDTNLSVKDDIDGQLRPQGGIFDIGADEAGTTTRMNGGVKVNGGVKIEKY